MRSGKGRVRYYPGVSRDLLLRGCTDRAKGMPGERSQIIRRAPVDSHAGVVMNLEKAIKNGREA